MKAHLKGRFVKEQTALLASSEIHDANSGVVVNAATTNVFHGRAHLEQHFAERTKALSASFRRHSDKLHGNVSGFVAKHTVTGALYMIKATMGASAIAFDKDVAVVDGQNNVVVWSKGKIFWRGCLSINDDGFVNEFVTAAFYKRFLYDRAPIISLVEHDDAEDKETANETFVSTLESQNYTGFKIEDISVVRPEGGKILSFLRSKYLNEFKGISQFTGATRHNDIGPDKGLLKSVLGAEKLFAAMLFIGELDIQAGNIGIMTLEDGSKVFAKIDHGWSATRFFSDPGKMLLSLANSLMVYHYEGVITFDPKKLKEAVDRILEISDYEIEQIIKVRLYELKKANVNLIGRGFAYWHDDTDHEYAKTPYINKTYNNYNELEEFWIQSYRIQKATFQGLSNLLNVISKIEGLDDKWLTEIAGWDPVEYAILSNLKIEGKEAILWAVDNSYTIGGKEPFQKFQPSRVEAVRRAEWLKKQFENLDLNFQRICNLWIWCKDDDLRIQIAKKAIAGGVKFYGIEAIKYLSSNNCESQAWANSELNKEIVLENPNIKLIQNLLDSGAFPNDHALKLMVEKNMPVSICGKSPKVCQQALHLDRVVASQRGEERDERFVIGRASDNFIALISNPLVIEGKPIIEYAQEKFPDLKYDGVGIADLFGLELSNTMPRANTALDNCGLNIACTLFRAGVKMHKDKSAVLSKFFNESAVQGVVNGREVKKQRMDDLI